MRIVICCTNVHCPFFVIVETVPVRTVNRQCSSGLQAVADVAAAIKSGYYDIGTIWLYMLVLLLCFSLAAESPLSLQTGIGAGLESMSINSMGWEGQVNPKVRIINHTVNWNRFFFFFIKKNFHNTFSSADNCTPESTGLSSAHGNYFWKCRPSIWCNQARARPGRCEFLIKHVLY